MVHTFHRSSATLSIDVGGDIALKRHGGWNSKVAVGNVDDSVRNKVETAHKIVESV